MADTPTDSPTEQPRRRPSSAAILLPPLLFLGAMFMAADFTAIAFCPLKVLQIPYPPLMDYAHFLAPLLCTVLWLATLRKWPNAGPILAVLLCFVLVSQIPGYAERRVTRGVTRVPVHRHLSSDEAKSLKDRRGVAVYQIGSRDGLLILVSPHHADELREELSHLGVLRAARPDVE